jgi:acyl-CoA synthetase (NDP forming)
VTGNTNLDFIFNPRSAAIVGISANAEPNSTNTAATYLESFLSGGFSGPIYPINHKGGEIRGRKIYPNVKDVPGPLDYVICCIQAPFVPQLIKDCAAKGVKVVQFFTAGFTESETEKGRELQEEIVALARQGGIRLIGPNCMGVYCPGTGVSFAPDFPKESGKVGYICQSGGNAHFGIRYAVQRGVHFSKVVSYGNACDVDESDLLEYLTADPETEIIAVYIEGVKDGKRFVRALKEAVAVKPVIVLKGGRTDAGARAAASHTGTLAGSSRVWEGVLRQLGVATVNSVEELADLLVTFLYLPVPMCPRLGTIGISGGATVIATDVYSSAGLVLPHLPLEVQQELRRLVKSEAGLSFDNPVDISSSYYSSVNYHGFKILAECDRIDIALFHLPLSIMPRTHSLDTRAALWVLDHAVKVKKESNKPIGAVVYNIVGAEGWETALKCQELCHGVGIPVYFSIDSAAKAISRFVTYHERRETRRQ